MNVVDAMHAPIESVSHMSSSLWCVCVARMFGICTLIYVGDVVNDTGVAVDMMV